jgi:integrase/recombinase XerD
MSHPSDPVLPIVPLPVTAIEGGKPTKARSNESPDIRHWQIEEFLRQTGKADNTQRVVF